MGSRVLSRSFTLSKEEEDDHENDVDNFSLGSAMDIDPPHNGTSANSSQEDNEEEGGEDEEETEVVMIPLADILNARYNTENVQPTPGFVVFLIG
jgi:SET domain-containing protein 6